MHGDGWIPREPLGARRRRVPSEFLPQRRLHANPPTLIYGCGARSTAAAARSPRRRCARRAAAAHQVVRVVHEDGGRGARLVPLARPRSQRPQAECDDALQRFGRLPAREHAVEGGAPRRPPLLDHLLRALPRPVGARARPREESRDVRVVVRRIARTLYEATPLPAAHAAHRSPPRLPGTRRSSRRSTPTTGPSRSTAADWGLTPTAATSSSTSWSSAPPMTAALGRACGPPGARPTTAEVAPAALPARRRRGRAADARAVRAQGTQGAVGGASRVRLPVPVGVAAAAARRSDARPLLELLRDPSRLVAVRHRVALEGRRFYTARTRRATPRKRGPIWINLNYLIAGALHHYAHAEGRSDLRGESTPSSARTSSATCSASGSAAASCGSSTIRRRARGSAPTRSTGGRPSSSSYSPRSTEPRF